MAVIVKMTGGLANRMFQYSYYLYLRQKGVDAYVDNHTIVTLRHEDFTWNRIFAHAPLRQAPRWKVFLYGGDEGVVSKIRRRYLPSLSKFLNIPNIYAMPDEQMERKSIYLYGYFQNGKFIDSIQPLVLAHFAFTPFEDERNREAQKQMEQENSVAIHIRKGKDYSTYPAYAGTCPREYYLQSIEMMKQKTAHPVFYIFTDNKEWVKENLQGVDYILVDWNPVVGWGNHFDMQLMTCCHHNIIANSTYSWWGAYLNPHEDKVVIAPQEWIGPKDPYHMGQKNQAVCDQWITI